MLTLSRNLNWWRARPIPGVWILLASLFACRALGQIWPNTTLVEDRTDGVCLLDNRKRIASVILDKMNEEIEPCNDFYQFACGNFINKTEIPANMDFVDTFAETLKLHEKQLTEIITEERPKNHQKHFRLPNILFEGCMNTTLIENLGAQPVHEISESLGGWPVVVGDLWDCNDTWTWEGLTKKLRRIGSTAPFLFSISVKPDKKTGRHVIDLDRPKYYLTPRVFNASMLRYYNYMLDVAQLFGVRKRASKEQLRESLKFETTLILISIRKHANKSEPYNLLSIKQLQESYPYVEWLDFINAMLPEHLKVDESELINLAAPKFFSKLGTLLELTSKRVIANYMMWKFHHSLLPLLSKEFFDRHLLFESEVRGKTVSETRREECVKFVLQNLQIAVASLYVRKRLKHETKRNVMEIYENIRGVFGQTLNKTQWLDDEAKEEAKKKLYSMKVRIAFPDELWDINTLANYYRDLEIHPNKFLQSYLNIELFVMDYTFGTLRLPFNDTEWARGVNIDKSLAFLSQNLNTLGISTALLLDQFFHNKYPKYMNYGAIGSIIAHEIIHAFCGIGCLYDAECEKVCWWKPSTEKAYQEKADCFIEQYGNYTDKQTGLKVNGTLTLIENIADNGGIKQSYMAYNQWVARKSGERSLPGLKYNAKQMFWISYAQIFCSKFTPEEAEKRLKYDKHSPHEFRVLALRNSKDFARDFHCSKNSPMNPEQKCEVF